MGRSASRVLVALAALAVLLLPVATAVTGPDVARSEVTGAARLADHAGYLLVLGDGTLVARETITARLPAGPTGLRRAWDTSDPAHASARLVPRDVVVELDGTRLDTDLTWQGGRRFRVATSETSVDAGTHVFSITYLVDGALGPGPGGGSLLRWDVVPRGWGTPIDRAGTRIALPRPADEVRCRAGAVSCEADGVGTDVVTLGATSLAAGTAMSARVWLAGAPPDRLAVPWPRGLDPVLGHDLRGLAVTVAASLLAVVAGHRLERRVPGRRRGTARALVTACAVALVALGLVVRPSGVLLPLAALVVGAAGLLARGTAQQPVR
jgi:hypothetical protein